MKLLILPLELRYTSKKPCVFFGNPDSRVQFSAFDGDERASVGRSARGMQQAGGGGRWENRYLV